MGTHKDIVINSQCIAILDTSILLLIAQNLVKLDDVFATIESCTPVIPIHVLNELKKLSLKPTEKGRLALWVLNNIAGKLNIIYDEVPDCKVDEVDCVIIQLSKKLSKSTRVAVLTADNELKKLLVENGIEVLWYRKAKNKLEPSFFI